MGVKDIVKRAIDITVQQKLNIKVCYTGMPNKFAGKLLDEFKRPVRYRNTIVADNFVNK